jgi:hypothetical protein
MKFIEILSDENRASTLTSMYVQKIKSLGIYSVYVSGQPSEAHVITKYVKRLSIGNINN